MEAKKNLFLGDIVLLFNLEIMRTKLHYVLSITLFLVAFSLQSQDEY